MLGIVIPISDPRVAISIREGSERAGGLEYPAGGGPGYKKDGRRRRRSHAANCCHVPPWRKISPEAACFSSSIGLTSQKEILLILQTYAQVV